MRSKLSCLAAAMIMCGALSSAHGADPKKGAAKKKTSESLDNFDKQMQWENNVMGPDDKKADMARLARANALAKAAAEKAATEKVAAEKQAAKEEATRKPATKSAAPVLLATPEDENAGKSTKGKGSDDSAGHEISPKLSTEAAMAPPPPVKPADDKFIDKLLKGEPGKKKVVRNDDRLDDLLAKDKIAAAPKPRGKRADSVDDLLKSAEKQPDVVVNKPKTPDWAKIDAPATPAPAPIAVRQQPKRDVGVIHVVQGAAGASNNPRPQMAAATPSRRATQNTDTFDRRDSSADPFADSAPRGRRAQAPSTRPASFADPFADGAPAARSRAAAAPPPPRPAPRAQPAAKPSFHDPFSDPPAPSKTVKREKPAGRSGGFKDPFSDAAPAVHHRSSMVALGDSHATTAKHSTGSAKGGNWAALKQPRH